MTSEDSKKDFKDMFNNLDVGYYKAELDGTIIEHNKAVNIIGGYDPSVSFVGTKTRELWDYIEEQDEYVDFLMKNGYVKNFVIHVTSPKGKKLVFITNSRIVKDKDNNPLYIEGIFTEVFEGYVVDKKLRKSQERLKFLVSSSPAVIYTSKISGDYGATYMSDNVRDFMGYEPDDFTKNSSFWIEHVHPEEREKVLSNLNALHENVKFTHEYRFLYKDGTYHWMLDECNLIRDENDNPVEIIGYWVDITKRKEMETKLGESEKKFRELSKDLEKKIEGRTKKLVNSEEKYRLISENANDIIAVYNEKLECEYINEKVLKSILGYSFDDIKGEKSLKIIHPDDLEKVLNNFKKTFKNGEGTGESRLKNIDGTYRWLESRGKVFTDKGKKKLILVSRDITDRKRVEQKLKESEEKFRTITEQSLIGTAILQDNKLIYVNQTIADMLGYTVEEITKWQPGKFLEIVHPKDKAMVVEQAKKKQRGEKDVITRYQYSCFKKTGETIWIEINSKSFNFNGRPAVLALLLDITEKKKAEKELKESEEKYREAFNRANFYKDLFAHDINNILQNIISASELSSIYMNNGNQQEKLSEAIEIVKEQVKKGAGLISKVRKLSEIEETQLTLEPTNISEVLKNSIDYSKNSFQSRDINIEIDSFSENIYIQANSLVSDLIENIIINGITHNRSPKIEINIKISKKQQDGHNYIRIEFIDNGVGIRDDQKKFIFEKKTDGYESGRGMGLGLSLVKKIIDNYNGQIWVEDRVKGDYSKGSNFVLLIPEAE